MSDDSFDVQQDQINNDQSAKSEKTKLIEDSGETLEHLSVRDDKEPKMKRDLQTRHLLMIALGGSIGTGLFVASGHSIANAGPGGTLVAYTVTAIMVFFLMTSLCEMATWRPSSGSFCEYSAHYVDPALGFAMGWNYWFNWAITVAVEIATIAVIIQYWLPNLSIWVFSLVSLILMFSINVFSVKSFGEVEFVMSIVKIGVVGISLIVGILIIFGAIGGPPDYFSNLTVGEAPFVNGISGLIGVFLISGFSFQGTELIGVTAGESANPEKSIPRSIKLTFWQIFLCYVLAIFVIGCVLPYTDENLLKDDVSNIAVSPFTLLFKRAGISVAAHIMNAVILVSVFSAGNSGTYASTRMVYSMAQNGMAPKLFLRLTKNGIPIYALIFTCLVASLSFLTSVLGPQVYNYLLAASGLSGYIAWLGVALSHFRFRRAFTAQNKDINELPYKSWLFPFGPIFSFILCVVVMVCQDLDSFAEGNVQGIIISYLSIPLFLILYFGYKIKNKTHIVPLLEIDLRRVESAEMYCSSKVQDLSENEYSNSNSSPSNNTLTEI